MIQELLLAIGFGLITTSVLALAAVGVTLQFGVTNYVNFAYGSYMALAAYLAWEFNVGLGVNIWVSIALSSGLMGVFAAGINVAILQPFTRRKLHPAYMLIVTLALWLMLDSAIVVVWGPNIRQFNVGQETPLTIGPFLFTGTQLFIIGLAAIVLIAIHTLLRTTTIGRAMRAMSDDETLAKASGINTNMIVTITWLLTGVLVGLSGCVLALNLTSFQPSFGSDLLFVIFAAVILGGIGQPYGTMLGALVIGMTTEIAAVFIDSAYKNDIAFIVMVVMLLVRPQGLIPARGRH